MKVDESAFLYMEPRARSYGSPKRYAQCETCVMWIPDKKLCMIHGPSVRATADTTCGLYVNGPPTPHAKTVKLVTPKESGAERREVRCENCFFYKVKGRKCLLFVWLNKLLGKKLADLRETVDPYGCCNANIKR